MPRDELSLFSYEMLGLIGTQGAGPHDLRRMLQRGGLMDWAGESRYYTEPKRLAKLGYLDSRREPGKTGTRTVYTLTEKGRQALEDWGRTPSDFTPLKSEPLTRMLVADIVGEEATRESLVALRERIDDIRERVRDMERAAVGLPHRRKYLELGISLMKDFLRIHEEWVDRVERELS
jgi:DNA-binding PadR family transcriptional regulator